MRKSSKTKMYELKARRTRGIVKMRKKLRAKGDRPSKITKSHFESICDRFISTIIAKNCPENFCPHFLIGSSNTHCFLTGGYGFSKAHCVFKTPFENKITGQAGEEGFIRTKADIMFKHPFAIHPIIPWHVATGDFIVYEKGNNVCVEIKTFTKIKDCQAFYDCLPKRALFQIWLQMDILDMKQGKIVIYHLDRVSKVVKLFATILIERSQFSLMLKHQHSQSSGSSNF